jgi:hypothetical protein
MSWSSRMKVQEMVNPHLPQDVWELVLRFLVEDLDDGELCPQDISNLRLTCRDMALALDSVLINMVDEGKSIEVSGFLPCPFRRRTYQKRVIMALCRAPLDLRALIRELGDGWMSPDFTFDDMDLSDDPEPSREKASSEAQSGDGGKSIHRSSFSASFAVPHLPNLIKIGSSFGEGWEEVESLDLSASWPQLAEIGLSFLSGAHSLKSIILPVSLQVIRDGAFCGCRSLRVLDLSATSLTEVGGSFLSYSAVEEVHFPSTLKHVSWDFLGGTENLKFLRLEHTSLETIGPSALIGQCPHLELATFPPTLRQIGDHFLTLKGNLHVVDLAHTNIIRLPERFLAEATALHWITFPKTLLDIQNYVLEKCVSLKVCDLRECQSLITIGNNFLAKTQVEEVYLPASVVQISAMFLAGSRIQQLQLVHTHLKAIGDNFLQCVTTLKELSMPRSIRSIGKHFLVLTGVKSVDFSGCDQLRQVGDCFLREATSLETFIFSPAALTNVGARFLSGTSVQLVDLRATKLQWCENNFLFGSEVSTLLLPASLKDLTNFFCFKTKIVQLDLQHTSVSTLPTGFASNCFQLEQILFPPTLAQVEDQVLQSTIALKEIDLAGTAVRTIGHGFLEGSEVIEVHLPVTVERLGDGFLKHALRVEQLDLQVNAGLEVIGEDFLRGTPLLSVRFPSSLRQIGSRCLAETPIREVDLSELHQLTVGKDPFIGCNALETVVLSPECRCPQLVEAVRRLTQGDQNETDHVEPADLFLDQEE